MEVALWVFAHGTLNRSVLAKHDVSTVCTLPHHISVTREHKSTLDISEEFTIAFFMVLLNICNSLKEVCDSVKAFSSCFSCKSRVHTRGTCPLIDKSLMYVVRIYVSICDKNESWVSPIHETIRTFAFYHKM